MSSHSHAHHGHGPGHEHHDHAGHDHAGHGHHHHGPPDPNAMLTWKIIAMVVLAGTAYGGCLLSLHLNKRFSPFVMQCFNCVAAGSFLAMAVFHIIPEGLMAIITPLWKKSLYGDEDYKDPHNHSHGEGGCSGDHGACSHGHDHAAHQHESPLSEFQKQAAEAKKAHHDIAVGPDGAGWNADGSKWSVGTGGVPEWGPIEEELELMLQFAGIGIFVGYTLILFFDRFITNFFNGTSEEKKKKGDARHSHKSHGHGHSHAHSHDHACSKHNSPSKSINGNAKDAVEKSCSNNKCAAKCSPEKRKAGQTQRIRAETGGIELSRSGSISTAPETRACPLLANSQLHDQAMKIKTTKSNDTNNKNGTSGATTPDWRQCYVEEGKDCNTKDCCTTNPGATCANSPMTEPSSSCGLLEEVPECCIGDSDGPSYEEAPQKTRALSLHSLYHFDDPDCSGVHPASANCGSHHNQQATRKMSNQSAPPERKGSKCSNQSRHRNFEGTHNHCPADADCTNTKNTGNSAPDSSSPELNHGHTLKWSGASNTDIANAVGSTGVTALTWGGQRTGQRTASNASALNIIAEKEKLDLDHDHHCADCCVDCTEEVIVHGADLKNGANPSRKSSKVETASTKHETPEKTQSRKGSRKYTDDDIVKKHFNWQAGSHHCPGNKLVGHAHDHRGGHSHAHHHGGEPCSEAHDHHGHGHSHGHGNCEGHSHGVEKNQSFLQSVMLLLALSVHGFTEGMVVGQIRNRNNILMMTFSVMMHLWVEAFVLCQTMLAANMYSYSKTEEEKKEEELVKKGLKSKKKSKSLAFDNEKTEKTSEEDLQSKLSRHSRLSEAIESHGHGHSQSNAHSHGNACKHSHGHHAHDHAHEEEPQKSNWKFWILASLHAMMIPLGILTHIVLSKFVDKKKMDQVSPWMSMVCGGTILYVCLTEIVPESFVDRGNWKKSGFKWFLFAFSGAVLIVVVMFTHDHSGCTH